MCPKFLGPHSQTFIYVFPYYSCSYISTVAALQASNTFRNSIYYLQMSSFDSLHLPSQHKAQQPWQTAPSCYCVQTSVNKSKIHFRNCLSCDGPLLWNSLPHEVHSASAVSSFGQRVNTHLFRMHIHLNPLHRTGVLT